MNKKLKELPLSTSTFKDIIEAECLYIDKTEEIYKLLEGKIKKLYFLSRPRRFGKSLLVSTLESIFKGEKELFKNLWIYDKIDFKKYPIIKIDFNNVDTSTPKKLEEHLNIQLNRIASNSKVIFKNGIDYKSKFQELVIELSKKGKVVVLIDEYDKAIIDHVDKIDIAIKNREILKTFYSSLKALDEYLHFVLITGVSKFSRVSVFSGLNNLDDITIKEEFSKILGITEEQLYSYFDEYIKKFAKKENITTEKLKEKLKSWYNGYSWNGKDFLYNPYSLVNTFNDCEIKNYWFQSGTPTFLIKLIKNYNVNIASLEKLILYEYDFDSYEVDNINVTALFFQTGYLTIKEVIKNDDEKEYLLSYPNKEVKESLLNNLLNSYINNHQSNGISVNKLIKSLKDKNLKEFQIILNSIFASIPNQIFPENTTLKDKEAYYHTIFHVIFILIGTKIQSEVSVSKGRIDSVIETDDRIYIFEFKIGRSPRVALNQIKENNYEEKYKASKKEIVKVGVNFSTAKRNIKNLEIK
ncbi:MAG: AAA family ATPase [Candidatus Sericytochromatia bacterium]